MKKLGGIVTIVISVNKMKTLIIGFFYRSTYEEELDVGVVVGHNRAGGGSFNNSPSGGYEKTHLQSSP